MGLSGYAKHAQWLAWELLQAVPEAATDALRQRLAGTKARQWELWCLQHRDEVQDYADRTPAQRGKKKWRQDAAALSMGAATLYLQGWAILHLHEQRHLGAGGSYRDTALSAAEWYDVIQFHRMPHWLYPDPSPFADEPQTPRNSARWPYWSLSPLFQKGDDDERT